MFFGCILNECFLVVFYLLYFKISSKGVKLFMVFLNTLWYSRFHPLSLCLIPFAGLFCTLVRLRRQAYRVKILPSHHLPVPVIIVGNLTIGGTGKTPLVIWLGRFFRAHGLKPGIVSRGYKGQAASWPQLVLPTSDPTWVGDEAILLARHSGCPVVVAPNRVQAGRKLLADFSCDLIISDDGLQHYALEREIEIAVVDGGRGYGNQRCLPAGPLREPMSRLQHIDFIINKENARLGDEEEIDFHFLTPSVSDSIPNIFPMHYSLNSLINLADPTICQPLNRWQGRMVHAIAGIGHPEHFFSQLEKSGLHLLRHTFFDHHRYLAKEIYFADDLPVIMTEKDAVKCQSFANQQHWYLPIEARLPPLFSEQLLSYFNKLL
jgi:tetraacyldisaccharide 4'-kinase